MKITPIIEEINKNLGPGVVDKSKETFWQFLDKIQTSRKTDGA
jgi:maleate cis-trans isomerase